MRVKLEQALQKRVERLIDQPKILFEVSSPYFDLCDEALSYWRVEGVYIFFGQFARVGHDELQLFKG